MNQIISGRKKSDNRKIKNKSGRSVGWLNFHMPSRLFFFVIGIISTVWFLIRVIPKPSRASYPCMRAAAPFMSGLVIYLFSVGGLTFLSRNSIKKINTRYISTLFLFCGAMIVIAVNPLSNNIIEVSGIPVKTGPDDSPNQPFGTAMGVKPGRVIWYWDTMATNRNCKDYYFKPENTNQKVVTRMFNESVTKLTGESSVSQAWDAMFRNFNKKKHNENKGYAPGEKIFIKINQTSGRGRLKQAEREKGNFYYPTSGQGRNAGLGTCETNPYIVLQILRQLVNECSINQSDIAVGDPQNPTFGHNYDAWVAEFPEVNYTDRNTGNFGRTRIHPTKNDLLFYSDKYQTDKLYDIIENADYMINVANLKPHSGTGITLTAKNHFGSQSRAGAYHLHYSHLSQIEGKPPTNAGYHKYRVLVDLMGSKYLGQNTLLFVIDGLYAGGASEGGPPVRYFMAPFNGNWGNSILISQDQVALESVCYDFLRTEWNGTYSHDPSNNAFEAMPAINGVDDYLHQAADSANWPKGIIYDPDINGRPIQSLGVHEHWNNPVNKQYSRNLGKSYGIELISVPANIIGPKAPEMIPVHAEKKVNINIMSAENSHESTGSISNGLKINSVVMRFLPEKFRGKKFYSGILDDDNMKYFLTDAGIVKINLFGVLDNMRMLPVNTVIFSETNKKDASDLRNFAYELSDKGSEFWIATNNGAIEATVPVDSNITNVNFYKNSNSGIISDDILSVAIGRNQLRWFGTEKGISALSGKKWLTPDYYEQYPEILFEYFPVKAMAASSNGDSLYVGTEGGGVARVYKNQVDAISGASQYLQWGPIEMPSDSVYSICISRDGTQWIGTDKGAARHTGFNTLENWTVFNNGNGLINNFVQAIAADPYGRYVWFGTKGGISVFDGTGWTSFTMKDGLISDNILFILIDKNGLVYFGTDNGIMVYTDGQLVCYM